MCNFAVGTVNELASAVRRDFVVINEAFLTF
jgi:hypothetical protein